MIDDDRDTEGEAGAEEMAAGALADDDGCGHDDEAGGDIKEAMLDRRAEKWLRRCRPSMASEGGKDFSRVAALCAVTHRRVERW